MARGKAKVNYLNREGLVSTIDAPNYDFLYVHSTVKSSKWDIGDRVVLPDGRVFRYALASGDLTEAGKGCKFGGTMADDGIALCSPAAAQVVGDKQFTVASQTFTKDELRGGYAVLYTTGSSYQQFGIIGNTAASNSTVTIYLDRALTVALASNNGIEVLPNPYRYMVHDHSEAYMSHAGIPASVAADAEYFWVQTWGICWCNPGPYGQGGSANERTLCFQTDGQLRFASQVTVDYQRAGFIVTKDASGTDSPPFLMLQISI